MHLKTKQSNRGPEPPSIPPEKKYPEKVKDIKIGSAKWFHDVMDRF